MLSVPGTYDEPKGIFLLEAMASGVPVVQPRRGAFRRSWRRPAAESWWNPTIRRAWPRRSYVYGRDRELAAELGRRGAQGVREHYSVAHMAARALEVYRNIAARCESMLEVSNITKEYPTPRGPLTVLLRRVAFVEARRRGGHHGAFGRGQEHAAVHRRAAWSRRPPAP